MIPSLAEATYEAPRWRWRGVVMAFRCSRVCTRCCDVSRRVTTVLQPPARRHRLCCSTECSAYLRITSSGASSVSLHDWPSRAVQRGFRALSGSARRAARPNIADPTMTRCLGAPSRRLVGTRLPPRRRREKSRPRQTRLTGRTPPPFSRTPRAPRATPRPSNRPSIAASPRRLFEMGSSTP